MRELLDHILVVGHFNPDTDACASAVGYAHFLNKVNRYEQPAIGAVPGQLTPQSRYVFDRAGIEYPLVVDNVSPRVGHVCTSTAATVNVDDRLGDALQKTIRRDLSMMPILGDDGKLQGVFSHRSEASKFLMGFDPTPLWGTLLTLDDLFELPGIETVQQVDRSASRDGELRVGLVGDSNFSSELGESDVAIVASLDSIDPLSVNQSPLGVVVVGARPLPEQLKKHKNCHILYYPRGIAEFYSSLTMHLRMEVLALPVNSCVGKMDMLNDVKSLLQQSNHALPVVSNGNRFEGVISRNDLNRNNRAKVVLVDHFEVPQAVPGLDEADVIEIVDHHRVGDIETGSPIRVDCRPVGSSCTIVAMNFMDHQIEIRQEIATILLGGIVADTLILNGPTTTDIDRRIAPVLAKIAEVDLQSFGTDVLVAGDDLSTSEPSEIWNRDQNSLAFVTKTLRLLNLKRHLWKDLPMTNSQHSLNW